VKLLTEAPRAECRGSPVRVTVVIPGGMATNMPANSGVSIAVDPEQVLIGRDAKLMDLFYRVNPSGAAALIARQMKGLVA
jgi:short-subunit dehydrogenase